MNRVFKHLRTPIFRGPLTVLSGGVSGPDELG
jgi:hypothetical protein